MFKIRFLIAMLALSASLSTAYAWESLPTEAPVA